MKKIKYLFNAILLSTMLVNTVSMHSMETNYKQDGWLQEYNYTVAQAKLLKNKIKDFMRLSTVCKHFSHKLTFETIGSLCKDYNQNTKDQVLQCLARHFFSVKARLPALILICAGANDRATCWGKDTLQGYAFFYSAVLQNDAPFIAALFKHGTSPDVKINRDPLFFSAKTIEIAQLFIDFGVNIYADGSSYNGMNVLWTMLFDEYPSEIMALYIKNNADATLRRWDKFCLLHAIGAKIPFIKNNGNNLLKKAALLLNAIPSMINEIDGNGRTPLDIAQEAVGTKFSRGKRDKVTGEYIEFTIPEVTETAEKLCVLFREHGGKTAQELVQ